MPKALVDTGPISLFTEATANMTTARLLSCAQSQSSSRASVLDTVTTTLPRTWPASI